MKTFPWLKNQSDAVGDSSMMRSRFRSDSGRRKLPSPIRNAAQNAPQIHGLLILSPPNAPLTPRSIPHATCGPVQRLTTAPLASSTVPSTTSPALLHQILTVHWCVVASYVSSSVNPVFG